MTIQEYKELCKKDVLRIGQDISVIKLGTEVKSKIHDDIQGDVVLLDRGNDYACLLYTSPSPRDGCRSRMPSSA